ncbi:MAG TPA: DUF4296 domain-containing protein [Flavobacterium sp.]|uniref:DUF4296 domain-containing protein n=1 Tax=unclassified Flavobacterium TaxID=196869 RepID=UPI0025C46F4D|nr:MULTISPECIES: DUF4296 domain-containing protein [unclassified Flavobacterium]HRE77570.1 DUF4296 domain-containing protein [Flavobacterium sp.]
MKFKSTILFFLLVFLSCNDDGVKKPSKLIEEEKMVDILYDLSILDALKSSNPKVLDENNIDSQTYIYRKYSIDSLQFVENTAFYASDLKKYKKMYETVEKRIEENKKVADSLLKIKQKEDNKKAEELRLLKKDSIKKPRNMKEANELLKNQK